MKTELAGRTLDLERIPADPDLQAFDQADRYALDVLVEREPEGRALVVLDAFGALACALDGRERASCADSETSRLALRANEARNRIHPGCPWTNLDQIEGRFDCALVKVPRQKALLEAALARIRPHLADGATVIGAGMSRHVHVSTIRAFEKWIGPTTTSRAQSRARLLLSRALAEPAPPKPAVAVEVEGEGFRLWLEPGVFARRGVDAGSALLARHVPRLPDGGRHRCIVDLGCGSGLLAAVAAERNPQAAVLGTDESHLSVQSARRTLEPFAHAQARVDDVLASVADASVDLVLCNPPQHQAAALSQTLLQRFVEESARVLRPDGKALMVANRHVNLNVALQSSFARVRILDQDRRFMVCEGVAPFSAGPRRP